MKIATQGHPTRGHEVIQILESLGGRNNACLTGKNDNHYYINHNGNTIECHDYRYVNEHCKKYTLKEFEKEFPFKIGDKVIDYEGDVATIIGFAYIKENLGYSLQYENGRGTGITDILKPYKEMEEKRNITITIHKAKEWYNEGGELRKIALQAFTEKELTKVDLPKTWEEFCEKYPIQKGECWLGGRDTIQQAAYCGNRSFRNWITSEQSAKAHLAMIQLEQLRDCWRQDWKPTKHNTGYCITHYYNEYSVLNFCFISFLSFPTEEMAEEFLKCFRDLIEQAGDLI